MTEKQTTHYLITGAAGFIGSHLSESLLAQGHRVTGIDNLSTGRIENIQHLFRHPLFDFARASIQDEIVMDRLASQADIIIHLAAAVGVQLIVEKPVHTIETNVMGTEAVLQVALRYGAKVLIASTSEVYGKSTSFPFQEDSDVLLGPSSRSRWAYAASKLVDEFLALAYLQEQGLPVVIFRLFNTVGPRQTGRYGMVIPRFVQQALNNEPLSVHGDGQQSRCFLHVKDAVRGIIGLSEHPDAIGQVFNIGSMEEVTIVNLARKILQRIDAKKGQTNQTEQSFGERIRFIPYEQAYKPGFEDMQRRVPDNTKIHSHIGWQPSYTLDNILEDVIASFTE
jgi:UDP-glucose 4-epimerase